jgi:hypothetical protein
MRPPSGGIGAFLRLLLCKLFHIGCTGGGGH